MPNPDRLKKEGIYIGCNLGLGWKKFRISANADQLLNIGSIVIQRLIEFRNDIAISIFNPILVDDTDTAPKLSTYSQPTRRNEQKGQHCYKIGI